MGGLKHKMTTFDSKIIISYERLPKFDSIISNVVVTNFS